MIHLHSPRIVGVSQHETVLAGLTRGACVSGASGPRNGEFLQVLVDALVCVGGMLRSSLDADQHHFVSADDAVDRERRDH